MNTELDYLYGLERLGIAPGLTVMAQMMDALGHPEQKFKSIHVTGTNGKGSTCAMLESILRASGYTTALYTSPHLYAFNERIQVRGVSISDEALMSLIAEIREVTETHNIHPTFFEFTTALAFLFFARSNIDMAIIEVGMGGTWDATNVITPVLSIITNVGLDHMEFLGSSTIEIAQEKAGIIKENVPVVTCEEDPVIVQLFHEVARQKHTHLVHAQDILSATMLASNFDAQKVRIEMQSELAYMVSLPLLGAHQIKNLVTVIAACTLLQNFGIKISQSDIEQGIAGTHWEGRLQIVSRDPLIIVDGAHNADGAQALGAFLDSIPSCDVLVFAAKKRKDISDMLIHVIPRFEKIIVTKGAYMPEEPHVLAQKIREMGKEVEVVEDTRAAVLLAVSSVPNHGTIVIAGSLYMIPEALVFLKESGV